MNDRTWNEYLDNVVVAQGRESGKCVGLTEEWFDYYSTRRNVIHPEGHENFRAITASDSLDVSIEDKGEVA